METIAIEWMPWLTKRACSDYFKARIGNWCLHAMQIAAIQRMYNEHPYSLCTVGSADGARFVLPVHCAF